MPDLRLRGGEVDGLDLHYIVEGRGPAVILLHGLGGFAESWRHTLRTLAGYRPRTQNEAGKEHIPFGVYGEVVEPGRVAVGDPVEQSA